MSDPPSVPAPRKVLHITNWYPNPFAPTAAPFVREQFLAVRAVQEGHRLIHVNVRADTRLPRLHWGQTGPQQSYLILRGPFGAPRLQEILILVLMIGLRLGLALRGVRWDIAHIHIAWPLLRYPRIARGLWGRRIVLSEHWSAYRDHFHLPPNSTAHKRLQKMLDLPATIGVVSQALARDIAGFAGRADLDIRLTPNVVEGAVFYPAHHPAQPGGKTCLMVANWAPIKRPFLVLEALVALRPTHPDMTLRIVGDGPQLAAMRDFVTRHGIADQVTFLGRLPKEQIAEEMRAADVFAHASAYETFSVVCAEALCCGVPLIASNVGGIPEFVTPHNGLLVENTPEAWQVGLAQILTAAPKDRHQISAQASARFSPQAVAAAMARLYEPLV